MAKTSTPAQMVAEMNAFFEDAGLPLVAKVKVPPKPPIDPLTINLKQRVKVRVGAKPFSVLCKHPPRCGLRVGTVIATSFRAVDKDKIRRITRVRLDQPAGGQVEWWFYQDDLFPIK